MLRLKEMAQQLRLLAIIAEDPGPIPSNYSLRASKAPFWLSWALQACGAHTDKLAYLTTQK